MWVWQDSLQHTVRNLQSLRVRLQNTTPKMSSAEEGSPKSSASASNTETLPWRETRRSGRPFEAFAKKCLEQSLARPLDPLQSASPVARLLSDNACRLYKPFSAVPARILAKVDYLGHGVGEYSRILDDSTLRPDKCGYTERGGDGMLERRDNGGLIVLQDKDHKHLDRADLTSFLDFTADCVTHNVNLGMERDDVHGFLTFPEDSINYTCIPGTYKGLL